MAGHPVDIDGSSARRRECLHCDGIRVFIFLPGYIRDIHAGDVQKLCTILFEGGCQNRDVSRYLSLVVEGRDDEEERPFREMPRCIRDVAEEQGAGAGFGDVGRPIQRMERKSELPLPLEEFGSMYRFCVLAMRRESLPGIVVSE